jgi:hypothetical protein
VIGHAAYAPLFEGVAFDLGHATDAILAAEQMRHLGVEYLPGKHARQLDDLAAIFCTGVAVELAPSST